MQDAIVKGYNIEKIKLELSKVTSDDYKGRTEYWKMANDILDTYNIYHVDFFLLVENS